MLLWKQHSSYGTGVSRFSNRLRDLIDNVYNGNSAKFAESAGLGQSTVSRLLRDLFQAHGETIATLASHLPREQAAGLCAAWLNDLIPPQLQYSVSITLTDAPNAMILQEGKEPRVWAELDQETRAAIEQLAALTVRSPDARDALVSTAAFLRGESFLSPEAETAVELASAQARKAKPPTRKQ
jgi:hypothetical protein